MSDEEVVVSQDVPQEPPQNIEVTGVSEEISSQDVGVRSVPVETAETPAPPPPPNVPQGPAKLLVVDDDSNFREIFSAKFGANGFEVKAVPSGKAATELLAKGEYMPDLILMDINMPGEAGTDVAMTIKQDPKTEHLRVAFLTNQKEPWPAITGSRDQVAKELGMEDFLEKGADLDGLVAKVSEILARPQNNI